MDKTNIDHPLEFLAEPQGRHIAVLYEDERRAKLVQMWYVMHGLVKGQHCIYTTHGVVDDARLMMKDTGIDIGYYEKERGLLHIKKIPILEHADEVNSMVRELPNSVFSGARPPFRSVVRLFEGELDGEEKERLCVEVEAAAQEGFKMEAADGGPFTLFAGLEGSVMCHHPVAGLGLDTISKLIAAHDATLLVPKSGHMKLVRTVSDEIDDNAEVIEEKEMIEKKKKRVAGGM